MNWDKKSIAAIFVSIVLFTVYMSYLQRKYPDYYAGKPKVEETPVANAPTSPVGTAPAAAPASQPGAAAVADQIGAPSGEQLSLEQLRIETATRIFEFDANSAAIKSIKLKNYQQVLHGQDPVELLDSPLTIQGTTQIGDRVGRAGYAAHREGNALSFVRRDGSWEITQTFVVPEQGYGLELKTKFRNLGEQPQELTAGVLMQENIALPAKSGGMFSIFAPPADVQSIVYSRDGKHNEILLKKFCEDSEEAGFALSNETLDFVGVDRHYFLSFLWAKGQAMSYELHRAGAVAHNFCPISLISYQRFGLVNPGAEVSANLTGYFGPKQLDIVENFDPALKKSLKLGWFSIFAMPLLTALKWIYGLVHNYGIAIILVTLVLKMAFYPLTRAAAISMKKMQKLQPEMNRLREKFKDNPQVQQRELMAFMSQHKVNPFKGCLPILPQIPVFIAFYNVLSQSIELRHAPFFGWLADLASRDPYFVTPILLGIGMFLQQKLTPNPGMDKNQEKIMLMMPIIFTVMMLSLPAGMVLYMITNTVVSILQQQWLNRRLAKQYG